MYISLIMHERNVGEPPLTAIVSCRNYYLLIVFFALATVYSFLDLQRQQRSPKGQPPAGSATVNGLGYAVVTLFHINLTVKLRFTIVTGTLQTTSWLCSDLHCL